MVEIDIKDTQVVWPTKFDKNGKLHQVTKWNLPFQIIEVVNEGRATRESRASGIQQSLFDIWSGIEGQSYDTGWKNKLIWGDNKFVMSSLLQRFAGKIDLIYIDPPFNTGDDFSYDVELGGNELMKEPSAIEVKAFNDTWGKGTSSYAEMMYDRLSLMKDLLSPTGSIYVHLDPNVEHYVKVMMDEIFGRQNFINEIIWKRTGAHNDATRCGSIHDSILLYSKTESYVWNRILTPLSEEYKETFLDQVDEKNGKRYARIDLTGAGAVKDGESGKPWRGINPTLKGRHWAYNHAELERLDKEGRIHWPKRGVPRLKRYEDELEGMPLQDVWIDIRPIHNQSSERVGFPTQKPETLMKRIIGASSKPGSLFADFFCGSGTSLVVAEKMGRRWIGNDLSRFAMHTTRKRLLGIEGCKPFEILNLGKYERQVWQDISFSGKSGQSVIYEYLAFILNLYEAQPISGFPSAQGRKGPALVHVGTIDAPVTIDEVMSAVNECVSARQTELHVLGWEWEMGLHDLVETEARKNGVKVRLLQIPNDVMDPQVSREDVRFFDLAYVQAKASLKGRTVRVELQDFVIPSSDLIPSQVREGIKHWSDLVDYWAVDFDFKNDTFVNTWQTYRKVDNPKLDLRSVPHEYPGHGKHNVVVKVVDIFGIDSSKLLEIEA